MTITVAPARNEYTANAAQTIFNYTFKIFKSTDLNVYITPSGQDANDSADLTVAYTVTGLGDEDGGTIILAVGTNLNDLVTIVSDVPSSRTTDYQNNGDFRPDVVNNDFDRVVSIVKKIEDTANRTVLLQQSQQDPKPLSLENPVAGFSVRWNASATGLENYDPSTVSNDEIANDKVVINYAALLAAVNDESLKLNQFLNIEEHTVSNGGGASWRAVASTSVIENGYEIVQCIGVPTLSLIIVDIYSPRQIGWTETGGLDNYNTMAHYINSGFATKKYEQFYTLNYFVTQWLNNKKFPLAFYGDSTTDGATTTGHVASVINGNEGDFNVSVTINNSPNSYPNKLDDNLNLMIGSANLAIYNAGFDSQSLANNFGNKAFHRVFYGFAGGLNNVDLSDTKGICLSWGTSDSINLNDIDTILDSYEWKMELLIVECFERGVQPFINDPVLNFQRTGSLVNGRQNDQSVSIIESINNRLRDKYGIEKMSLRKALENYVENGFEQENDFTEVIAVDGVHPNDKGHAHIAGTFTAQLHPLVKSLTGSHVYKFTAGNFYPITLPTDAGVDIWKPISNAFVVTGTSFYYKWENKTNNEFLYRIFVFCEQPMDLTYNMLSFGNSQNSESKFTKLEVINYTTVTSKKGVLLSDNQGIKNIGQGVPWFGGGHQLLARLQVGFNQINVTAADIPLSNPTLGYLRAQPRNERNTILETVNAGVVTFDQTVQHKDIKRIVSSASSVISWSEKDFNMNNFHYSKLLETTRIMFSANTLHDRNIYWNANRSFRFFDCYNVLKFSGTSITLWRADATNGNAEVTTETQIGTAVSPVDLSTVVTDNNYMISIVQNTVSDTDVIVQYTDPVTGITTNLAVIALTTSQPYHSGYSVGAFKASADSLPMLINNITVDFSA